MPGQVQCQQLWLYGGGCGLPIWEGSAGSDGLVTILQVHLYKSRMGARAGEQDQLLRFALEAQK